MAMPDFPIDPELLIRALAPVVLRRQQREIIEDGVTGFVVEDEKEAVAAAPRLSRSQFDGALRSGSPHGGWRLNILTSTAA
jgi:hypothetical protein